MDLYNSHINKLASLTLSEQQRAAEISYQQKVEQLLADDNCFKLTMVCYTIDTRV